MVATIVAPSWGVPPTAVAALRPAEAPAPSVQTACFALSALPEPGLMARVLEQFAKRNLVPHRWHAAWQDTRDFTIDIQIPMPDWPLAEQIAATLRQIVGVSHVLLSAKVTAVN